MSYGMIEYSQYLQASIYKMLISNDGIVLMDSAITHDGDYSEIALLGAESILGL
jgi:hypothetical protein